MIFLATSVALCDVLFVLVAVPESLPEKVRPASWGAAISWEQADPFNVSEQSSMFKAAFKVKNVLSVTLISQNMFLLV